MRGLDSGPVNPTESPPARYDPEVALPWVISMRWVAAAGQACTVLIATSFLGLDLPLEPLGGVIAATFLSNVGLRLLLGRARARDLPIPRLLPAVLTLDTLLLTSLLCLSGGPQNPFTFLFVVHVALAAVALGSRWAWGMAGLSAVCYAVLYHAHVPLALKDGSTDPTLQPIGLGISVFLVAAVIAYFTTNIARDLRAREADLREAKSRMARNEWLASLAALAGGAAHELGTPLGTIAVVAKELQRAAERLQDGEAIVEDARLIRSQVDRCRRIIDRLTAVDQQGLGNPPQPVSIEDLVRDLREDQAPAMAEAFRVEVDDATGEGVVHPDVAQALQPLLKNALDATNGEADVTLTISQSNGHWQFVVRDEGPGMSGEVRQRAIEPFFTTKEHGQGMGLGLYLVHLIAERHGGSLLLESQPETGTTATLLFPAGSTHG